MSNTRADQCIELEEFEVCKDISWHGLRTSMSGPKSAIETSDGRIEVELGSAYSSAFIDKNEIDLGWGLSLAKIEGDVWLPRFTIGDKTYEINLGMGFQLGTGKSIYFKSIFSEHEEHVKVKTKMLPVKGELGHKEEFNKEIYEGAVRVGPFLPSFKLVITDNNVVKEEIPLPDSLTDLMRMRFDENIKSDLNSHAETFDTIESKFNISKHLDLIHKKMNLIMSAHSDEDMTQFENEPAVKKTYEEVLRLRQSNGNDNLSHQERLFEKEKELRQLKTEVMVKRIEFTKAIKQTNYAISGASSMLGLMGETDLAEKLNVLGQSTLDIFENGAALLGSGLLAGVINPLMAFSSIAGATYNIVNLFKPKAQESNPISILLPYIQQLAQDIHQLKQLTADELAAIKHQLYENHLIALEKFVDLAHNQQEMVSTLQNIYFEMRGSFAAQSDKLRQIQKKLSSLEYKIDSMPYRQDIDNLKKIMRYILENTDLEFNKLSNELDNIGLENSIAHQLNNIFDLVDNAGPFEYFQLINYFKTFIQGGTDSTLLPNPLLLLQSSIANLLLNLLETPNPNAKFPTERILLRDILRLKNYNKLFIDINTLFNHARNATLLSNLIDNFHNHSLNLVSALDNRTVEIEEQYTKDKQMRLDQALLQYKQDLSNLFSTKFEISDYGWYKGHREYRKRWHVSRKWHTNYPANTPYVDPALNTYLRETEARVTEQRHAALKSVRESAISSKLNHLSSTKKNKISPYHGAGFIIPQNDSLPILPAPDPLLSSNHPQFHVLHTLQEAQRFGLGYIEFEYSAEKQFSIVIYFNFFMNADLEKTKLEIAAIHFSDFNSSFYKLQEAVWYYWMGGRIAPDKEGKIRSWHTGRNITHHQAAAGSGWGHRGGEFEYEGWIITVPKEFVDQKPKINEIYNMTAPLQLVNSSLEYIEKIVDAEYQKLQKHVDTEIRNDLDYSANHHVGTHSKSFEESYRHLYGTLTIAYFDLMHDVKSNLSNWFAVHSANVKSLKERHAKTSLDELIRDIPVLRKIIHGVNNASPSFHVLAQVNSILEDFIDIYEPNAIEYNEKQPRKEQASKVADTLTEILINIVYNVILTNPQAISADVVRKAMAESQLDSLDEHTRYEIEQRILAKWEQKSIPQLPQSETHLKQLGVSDAESECKGSSWPFPAVCAEPLQETFLLSDDWTPTCSVPEYKGTLTGDILLFRVLIDWAVQWLPGNKKKLLTSEQRDELNGMCNDIHRYTEHHRQLSHGLVTQLNSAYSGLHDTSRLLMRLSNDIRETLDSYFVTENQVAEIKKNLKKVSDDLTKFAKIESQMIDFEKQQKELQNTGKQLIACYNPITNQFTTHIEDANTLATDFNKEIANAQPIHLSQSICDLGLFRRKPILRTREELRRAAADLNLGPIIDRYMEQFSINEECCGSRPPRNLLLAIEDESAELNRINEDAERLLGFGRG